MCFITTLYELFQSLNFRKLTLTPRRQLSNINSRSGKHRKGEVLVERTLINRHLAPTLFYHLPCFYDKTGFLNPHPLSLGKQ